MEKLPISLEFYPQLDTSQLMGGKSKISQNKDHWDYPFFMDVYKYADLEKFKKVCKPFLENPEITNIIVLGTGGSYQTLKALALFASKNLIFLTSSRPFELANILSTTAPNNSVVIPISRGGKTLDVNSILPLFQEYPILALSSQGPMFDLVKKLNATIIPVPDLSGRYAGSVSSVALVPALLSGIDVEQFQKGLETGYSLFKDVDHPENIAMQYSILMYHLFKKGYRNIFSMPYTKWLEGTVGLFVQEISESSGKDGLGLMGTYQEAPLCQHSVLELLLGGSKGHTSPLLWTALEEPVDVPLEALTPELEGQTGLSVINYQLDATFQALLEQAIPAAKVTLDEITPFSLGVAISFVQSSIYYFCLQLDINWSSNPLVLTGKAICNDALAKKLDIQSRKSNRLEIARDKFSNFLI